MEGPVWFQYHLLVSKKRIAHFRSDSNSKIKICGALLPKSGSEQRNPCYLPNSQVYWTLDCTFSVANDFNVDRESPMERKGTISKDDIWFIELFFYEEKEKQFLIIMLLFL